MDARKNANVRFASSLEDVKQKMSQSLTFATIQSQAYVSASYSQRRKCISLAPRGRGLRLR
eukprot:6200960-Pleurochrysis_carterae.AAC.1